MVPVEEPAADPVARARDELARGNYVRAGELTRNLTGDPAACALHVRALANVDLVRAEQACAEAVGRHPLATEMHYLHAILLLALQRDADAIGELRRVLYLDRSLAIAHFTLASILERRGDRAGAARAYRNVYDLCASRPEDDPLPLADGARAGTLAEAAAARLSVLS